MRGMRQMFIFRASGVKEGLVAVNRGWQSYRSMKFWLNDESPETMLRMEVRYYKDKIAYRMGMFRYGEDWNKFIAEVDEAASKYVDRTDI
jgi:predicted aminopeptidase